MKEETRLFWVWVPEREDAPDAVHAATPEEAAREVEVHPVLPPQVVVIDPHTGKRWTFAPERKVTYVLVSAPAAAPLAAGALVAINSKSELVPAVVPMPHPGPFEPVVPRVHEADGDAFGPY